MADGDVLLYVGGSKTAFRCECGANVFKKHTTKEGKVKYYCNGCPAVYCEDDDDEEETKGVVAA